MRFLVSTDHELIFGAVLEDPAVGGHLVAVEPSVGGD